MRELILVGLQHRIECPKKLQNLTEIPGNCIIAFTGGYLGIIINRKHDIFFESLIHQQIVEEIDTVEDDIVRAAIKCCGIERVIINRLCLAP
ncbi:hypothetical protein CCR82_08360 [Halochromatium salexigens]|uniref:Uncharacterized protein n=1 Tax=Halochromatium salexigens TaxID=49447 RepID=A0AAJ0UHA5_HALSE|nr:hypothetical protein [Halochromatium salexigens]